MAKKQKRKAGYFEGTICARCELPLEDDGTCPNDRCPYHDCLQDEIAPDGDWPSEEESKYIREIRERLKGEP